MDVIYRDVRDRVADESKEGPYGRENYNGQTE